MRKEPKNYIALKNQLICCYYSIHFDFIQMRLCALKINMINLIQTNLFLTNNNKNRFSEGGEFQIYGRSNCVEARVFFHELKKIEIEVCSLNADLNYVVFDVLL